MSPNEGYELLLKNSSSSGLDGVNVRVPQEVRDLRKDLSHIGELDARAWKEVYEALLKRLTELHDPWQVLAVIYRQVELRSDFITAARLVGKFTRHFSLLFEKLPGHPSYFIPSAAGRWLFESLISSREEAEVKARAERQIAAVRQLALTAFLPGRRGVRA